MAEPSLYDVEDTLDNEIDYPDDPNIYTGSWVDDDGVTHIEISDINDLYDAYFINGKLIVKELVF